MAISGEIIHKVMASPFGELVIAADDRGLRIIEFGRMHLPADSHLVAADPLLDEAERQLGEYFRRGRHLFDLPLALDGTPFQMQVWQALTTIPYGETISYGELARRLGKPAAVRAVGAANGRNPISIVVPCHRVIGSDGTLTGYAGGLPLKEGLLALEGSLKTGMQMNLFG